MNEFDQYVKHVLKEQYYIRYADDFVFFSQNKQTLTHIRQKCEAFLTEHLALTLHPNKVSVSTVYAGVDLLGWVHFPKHRVLRTTTKRRMLKQVNEQNLTSYIGLLSHGNTFKLQRRIILIGT